MIINNYQWRGHWWKCLMCGSGRSPGGGNGNPLQYPCLGNPMDRGAWRATVHAKSQTQLKWPNTRAMRKVHFFLLYPQSLRSVTACNKCHVLLVGWKRGMNMCCVQGNSPFNPSQAFVLTLLCLPVPGSSGLGSGFCLYRKCVQISELEMVSCQGLLLVSALYVFSEPSLCVLGLLFHSGPFCLVLVPQLVGLLLLFLVLWAWQMTALVFVCLAGLTFMTRRIILQLKSK